MIWLWIFQIGVDGILVAAIFYFVVQSKKRIQMQARNEVAIYLRQLEGRLEQFEGQIREQKKRMERATQRVRSESIGHLAETGSHNAGSSRQTPRAAHKWCNGIAKLCCQSITCLARTGPCTVSTQ